MPIDCLGSVELTNSLTQTVLKGLEEAKIGNRKCAQRAAAAHRSALQLQSEMTEALQRCDFFSLRSNFRLKVVAPVTEQDTSDSHVSSFSFVQKLLFVLDKRTMAQLKQLGNDIVQLHDTDIPQAQKLRLKRSKSDNSHSKLKFKFMNMKLWLWLWRTHKFKTFI